MEPSDRLSYRHSCIHSFRIATNCLSLFQARRDTCCNARGWMGRSHVRRSFTKFTAITLRAPLLERHADWTSCHQTNHKVSELSNFYNLASYREWRLQEKHIPYISLRSWGRSSWETFLSHYNLPHVFLLDCRESSIHIFLFFHSHKSKFSYFSSNYTGFRFHHHRQELYKTFISTLVFFAA